MVALVAMVAMVAMMVLVFVLVLVLVLVRLGSDSVPASGTLSSAMTISCRSSTAGISMSPDDSSSAHP